MFAFVAMYRFMVVLLFFSVSFCALSQPNVTFQQIPSSLQFYARDSASKALVPIEGSVNTFGYTAVAVYVFRNNSLYSYQKKTLFYSNNKAVFSFNLSIQAGLYEYSFKIYAFSDEDSILISKKDSIVCGDAYLVSGQSNARFADDLETYQNEYCRTFGKTTSNGNATYSTLEDTLWCLAKANGYTNVGVWAMNLMRLLVEKHQVPICVLNGAVSQTKIFKHIKDTTDPHYFTQSYYGRLHYRALKSGLDKSIRGIFWYHGESNADELFSAYQPYFNQLYTDWNSDYPSAKKIYLFQINVGCTSNSNSGNFREGQRNLSESYPKIRTIATVGTPHYDGCHYDTAGYHFLAKQVFEIVSSDFYGQSFETDQYSPEITKAYYTSANSREIILEFSNATRLFWQNDTLGRTMASNFYLDGNNTLVSSGYCYQNKVRLLLKSPNLSRKISYLPSYEPNGIFLGPYIRNKNRNAAFSFYDVGIEPPPEVGSDETCPAAFGPIKHVYGTNRKNTSGFAINKNTTWYNDTIYVLHGYVRVVLGATLTIMPGTVVMGAMMPRDTSLLVIQKGAKLYANGTQKSPIVFTSCRTAGTRNRGDWGGIVICGNAPNNQGNNIELEGGYKAYHGGPNKVDNSGSMQYVRIEYAGIKFNDNEATNSLTLASVGSGTTMKYIQTSFSNDDSFEWLGGTVNSKYLLSWKPLDDDFDTDLGYSGFNQFGLGFRDFSSADISGSCGFESDNNKWNVSALPKTAPIFSNFESWGPKLTATSPYNAFFKAGALLQNGTEIKFYNTLLFGWPGDSIQKRATLYLNDLSTVTNAKNDSIRFRNCYIGSYLPNFHYYSEVPASTWLPTTMKKWYQKPQNLDSTANNVMYTEKKAPFREIPLFTISSTNSRFNRGSSFTTNTLPKLPLLPSGFFQSVSYRGAFGGTNWAQDWAEFNPQLVTYSTNQYAYRKEQEGALSISCKPCEFDFENIYPNPSNAMITVSFSSKTDGIVNLSVLDLEGKKVYSRQEPVSAGNCEIRLDVAKLKPNPYLIQLSKGSQFKSKLFIVY